MIFALFESATDAACGKWECDERDNLVKRSDPPGAGTLFEYAGGWQTQYRCDLSGLEMGRSFAGGVTTRTERDSLGRIVGHKTEKNNRYVSEKSYLWGISN
jgi:YD repeat-containing protein